jgi:hypothetical protein
MAADKTAGHDMPLVKLEPFLVAAVPDAASYPYAMILVTDAATNAIPCWSDGTNWKRFDTGATVS